MNNLTINQQQIVNQLVAEFDRMNQSNKPNKKFNFIDTNSLSKINQEIKEFKQLAEADAIAWERLANQRAQEIVDLLKEDLDGYCVQKYGKENGHYDMPSVLIRHNEKTSTHPESCVSFDVYIKKERRTMHDTSASFGVSLYYCTYCISNRQEKFETIEELLSNKYFQQSLRERVIR